MELIARPKCTWDTFLGGKITTNARHQQKRDSKTMLCRTTWSIDSFPSFSFLQMLAKLCPIALRQRITFVRELQVQKFFFSPEKCSDQHASYSPILLSVLLFLFQCTERVKRVNSFLSSLLTVAWFRRFLCLLKSYKHYLLSVKTDQSQPPTPITTTSNNNNDLMLEEEAVRRFVGFTAKRR